MKIMTKSPRKVQKWSQKSPDLIPKAYPVLVPLNTAPRPNVGQILVDEFITMGFLPTRLQVSCLTIAPRFDTKMNASLIARRTTLTG